MMGISKKINEITCLCRIYQKVFLFILYTCLSPQIESSTVRWTLRTEPVIFGEDVILYCDPGTNFSLKPQRKFKLGKELLTFDEGPLDRNKYGGTREEKGFTLIIKKFQESDFNKNYTCAYGFDHYTANLTTPNYQWNPRSDKYAVYFNSSLSQLEVYIDFQKIYPNPTDTCEMLIWGNKVPTIKSQLLVRVVDKYFYAIKLSLKYQYKWSECGEEVVSINCKIGTMTETMKTFNASRSCAAVCQQYSPCLNNGTCLSNTSDIICFCTDGFNGDRCENPKSPDTTTIGKVIDDNSNDSTTTMVLVIVSVVAFCVVALLALMYFKRNRNLSRTERGNDQNTLQDVTSALFDPEAI